MEFQQQVQFLDNTVIQMEHLEEMDDSDIETSILQEKEELLNQIQNDLIILQEIVDSVNELVYDQKDNVDQITLTVDRVEENIELGNEQLEQALGYNVQHKKTVTLTIGGAVIGGLLTGGIGSVFGLVPAIIGLGLGSGLGSGIGATVSRLKY